MKLSCWITSAGAKQGGLSPCLIEYATALRKVLDRTNPSWLDDLFDGHEYCTICGQS